MKKLGYPFAAILATFQALGSAPSQAADDEGWQFSIAPMYLWGKTISGHASAGGKALPLELDFKDDILENLDAALAFHFEAQKDRIALFFEYNFARLDPSSEIPGPPVTIKADVEFEDIMIEGGVTWAFAETGSTRWEVLGGLRYYDQDVEVKISTSGPGLLPSKVEVGDSWVQPFAGVRTMTRLSERWSFRARADYGYETSDNTALSGLFFFDYRFRGWGSAFVGYRYLDIDFDNGSNGKSQYGFDGDQQGPLIGLNLYF
jgi:hypothetical protein